MRQVARYVFSSDDATAEATVQRYQRATALVSSWITQKGWRGSPDFTMADGRSASIEIDEVEAGDGEFKRWRLLEEIPGGLFETMVGLARSADRVHVSASLAAGHNTNQLAPLQYEARCPSVLRQLAELPWGWRLGRSSLATAHTRFRGPAGGDALTSLLLDTERSLPVVAISTHFGLALHREMETRMARDLIGLATVAVVDDEAAWTLTQRLGKTLSCYNGAVRLYWPGLAADSPPTYHPLWTAERLLSGAGSVDAAEKYIREMLRKRLMAVSVPALAEASVFERVRAARQQAEEATRRAELVEAADYKKLAEEEADKADRMKLRVAELEGQIQDLRQQLWRVQAEDAWADGAESISPDDSQPPETVEEAVSRAKVLFAGRLRFGADVDAGVRGLNKTAGPPDKVLKYLRGLADLASARQSGPLGKGMMQWLGDRGIDGSGEFETISNNKAEQRKRTWDNGAGARRVFDFHLKPNEATQPDQCVRIYFDWDEAAAQVVVAWVGRHP